MAGWKSTTSVSCNTHHFPYKPSPCIVVVACCCCFPYQLMLMLALCTLCLRSSLRLTGASIPLAHVVAVNSCNLHWWWCFFTPSVAQIAYLYTWWYHLLPFAQCLDAARLDGLIRIFTLRGSSFSFKTNRPILLLQDGHSLTFPLYYWASPSKWCACHKYIISHADRVITSDVIEALVAEAWPCLLQQSYHGWI